MHPHRVPFDRNGENLAKKHLNRPPSIQFRSVTIQLGDLIRKERSIGTLVETSLHSYGERRVKVSIADMLHSMGQISNGNTVDGRRHIWFLFL